MASLTDTSWAAFPNESYGIDTTLESQKGERSEEAVLSPCTPPRIIRNNRNYEEKKLTFLITTPSSISITKDHDDTPKTSSTVETSFYSTGTNIQNESVESSFIEGESRRWRDYSFESEMSFFSTYTETSFLGRTGYFITDLLERIMFSCLPKD